jgi:hypothetical protein
MTGDEVMKVVDFIHATWNTRVDDKARKAAYSSWGRFVGKLEYNDVMDALERQALASKWAPKPADIWSRVVAPGLPTDQEAWIQAQQLLEAVSTGTDLPDIHPEVAKVCQLAKGRLTERSFLALWEHKKADYLMELFNG